jgi:hypothetical protein
MSKIEAFWENATAKDAEELVRSGKPIGARFRDFETDDWYYSELVGWFSNNGTNWMISGFVSWRYCQVYREPSWYADKPDPGPGFRLLEKFPDEELKPGDELWLKCNKSWELSDNAHADRQQDESLWYRRRIEAVEPVEHYLGKVEVIKQFIVGDTFRHPNGLLLKITEKGFEVTQ